MQLGIYKLESISQCSIQDENKDQQQEGALFGRKVDQNSQKTTGTKLQETFVKHINIEDLCRVINENREGEAIQLIESMDIEQLALKSVSGSTAMHVAVKTGQLNAVNAIIRKMERNKLEEMLGEQGEIEARTALHYAVLRGHTQIAKTLIENMSPQQLSLPDAKKRTVLHSAAYCGHLEIAQLLIKKMSPEHFTLQDADEATALDTALSQGYLEIAKALIEKMSPEQLSLRNVVGRTILHYAAYCGYLEITQLLIKKMSPEQLTSQDTEGNAALHFAAYKGHIEIIKFLIDIMSPEQLGQKVNDGRTALEMAHTETVNDEIVQLLKEKMNKQDLQQAEVRFLTRFFINFSLKKSLEHGSIQQKRLHDTFSGSCVGILYPTRCIMIKEYVNSVSNKSNLDNDGLNRINKFRRQMLDDLLNKHRDLDSYVGALYKRIFLLQNDPNSDEIIRLPDGTTTLAISGGCRGHHVFYQITYSSGKYQFIIHNRGLGISDKGMHGSFMIHRGDSVYYRTSVIIEVEREHLAKDFLRKILQLKMTGKCMSQDVYSYINQELLQKKINNKTGSIVISPQEKKYAELLEGNGPKEEIKKIEDELLELNIFQSAQSFPTCSESNFTSLEKKLCSKETYLKLKLFTLQHMLSQIRESVFEDKQTKNDILELGEIRELVLQLKLDQPLSTKYSSNPQLLFAKTLAWSKRQGREQLANELMTKFDSQLLGGETKKQEIVKRVIG